MRGPAAAAAAGRLPSLSGHNKMTIFAKIRVLAGLALVFALLALIVTSYQSPPHIAVGEGIAPDETATLTQIVDSGLDMVDATRAQQGDGMYRRDAHAKTDGCARATFSVYPSTDFRIRHGLFRDAKQYLAWIRYSNSNTAIQNDWIPDARGMAIKVLGVAGEKLLDGEQDDHTQDFIMVNNPVFVVPDVKEYAALVRYMGQDNLTGFYFPSLDPGAWRLRELRLSMAILKFPRNLLADRFYSLIPYRLGTANYVKYSAKAAPCSPGGHLPSSLVGFGRDALRTSLTDQLKRPGARFCYDFMVQFQAPDAYMPVEDATIEWSERQSPFIPVARIEIGPQDVNAAIDNHFCENLSMSPWHSLPEHQPVGGLNRIRRLVYQQISRFRRCKNGFGYGEPLDDGSMKFDSPVCNPHEPVPAIGSNPAPSGH